MYLIVDDLLSVAISQNITTINSLEVGAVRLYLYKELNPSGNLDLTIKSGVTTLYTESKTISSIIAASSLMTTTNYFHGFLTWILTKPIRLERESTYTIELEGTNGYSSGFSWVKEYENPSNNFTSTITDIFMYPHSIQLWEKKDNGMGLRILDFTDGFTSASAPTSGTSAFGSIEVDFDGFIYRRQVAGTDTEGDYRTSTVGSDYIVERYESSVWVEKGAFEA